MGGAMAIYIKLQYSGTGPTRTVLISREAEMVSNISKEMMQLLGWLFI